MMAAYYLFGFFFYHLSRFKTKCLTVYKSSLVKGHHGKISGGVTLFNPTHISLGANSYINSGSYLHAGSRSEIHIGENCLISYNVHIRTVDHIHDSSDHRPIIDQGITEKNIYIGNNVWIGYGAQILPGVSIGNNVIIGAGAVVTHDVDDNCVVGGVPAKRIKSLYE